MTHASIFSGIGGFDIAAEWMGWENKFHCEWNPFAQKILKYYWPKSISYHDITKTNFTIHKRSVDVLTGGFPCQPYSSAGKRLGNKDERHLWPEMLRCIKEIAPRFIVAENVRGLTNWNGGLVFDEVCIEMENIGYQVAPFIIPASGINAPHKRERIFFIAHANESAKKYNKGENNIEKNEIRRNKKGDVSTKLSNYGNATNSNSARQQKAQFQKKERNEKNKQFNKSYFRQNNWDRFPTEYPLCSGNDGISEKLDGITFYKWRDETLKGYGNAIVPQIAFNIFKIIEKFNNETNTL